MADIDVIKKKKSGNGRQYNGSRKLKSLPTRGLYVLLPGQSGGSRCHAVPPCHQPSGDPESRRLRAETYQKVLTNMV